MRLPSELRSFIKTASLITLTVVLVLGLSGLLLLALSWYFDLDYSQMAHGVTGGLVPILLTLTSFLIRLLSSFRQDNAIQEDSSDSYFEGI